MKKQSGLTLIGFLFILIIVGFFAYAAMKLVPAYVEYFGVVKAMNAVASEPGVASKSPEEIHKDLAFKGSFQYVDDETLKTDNIHIKTGAGGGTLQVKYDKDISFIYNIDFLLHFEKTVMLKSDIAG